jgi:hypothetical protein
VGVGRQAVVAVCGYAVVLLARLLHRIDVHHDRLQVAQLMQEAVVDLANPPPQLPRLTASEVPSTRPERSLARAAT